MLRFWGYGSRQVYSFFRCTPSQNAGTTHWPIIKFPLPNCTHFFGERATWIKRGNVLQPRKGPARMHSTVAHFHVYLVFPCNGLGNADKEAKTVSRSAPSLFRDQGEGRRFMHNRSLETIDPRTPTMPGRRREGKLLLGPLFSAALNSPVFVFSTSRYAPPRGCPFVSNRSPIPT